MPPRRLSLSKWIDLLAPGMRVFVQGGVAEPLALAEILAAAPERAAGVDFTFGLVPGINNFDYAALDPSATLTSIFLTEPFRQSFEAGKLRLMPLHYSSFYAYLEQQAFDLALLHLAPPNVLNLCSLGVASDFAPAVLPRAKKILAQINPQMPQISNGPSIPWSQLSFVVEAEQALPEFPAQSTDDVSRKIAANVTSMIEDRDCLQIGIGRLPSSILTALKNHRDIGFHTGLITPPVLDLIDSGAANGRGKTLDRSLCVTGLAIGTKDFYGRLNSAPISFRPVNYTHNLKILSGIEKFVSINTALEVDLFGQSNAEILSGRQISGTGGFVDFQRGASLSPGGRSIIALPATAHNGTQSRICAQFPTGAFITGLRTDVDCVVTEYGIARLRNRSIDHRAEALIDIAAPQFRNDLSQNWSIIRSKM